MKNNMSTKNNFSISVILPIKSGSPAFFEDYFKKAIESDPNRREGYVLLSTYYFKKKRWSKAYKNAEQALKITKKILDVGTDNFAFNKYKN